MTSNDIPEDFPKKLTRIDAQIAESEPPENRICPSSNQCPDKECPERKPHVENSLCKKTCLLEPGHRYVGQCI